MGTNYYTVVHSCSNRAHDVNLHIGKSSGGWKFGFRAHDDLGLTSWAAWREYLKRRTIVDEYGDVHSLDDFTSVVEIRRVPNGEETAFCRINPSPLCISHGFGGRWYPPEETEHGPSEFHDDEGYDFSRRPFS